MFEDILGPDVEKESENYHVEIWKFADSGETVKITVNWTQKFVSIGGNLLDLSKTRLYDCAHELKAKIVAWGKEDPFEYIDSSTFKVFDGWRIK